MLHVLVFVFYVKCLDLDFEPCFVIIYYLFFYFKKNVCNFHACDNFNIVNSNSLNLQ